MTTITYHRAPELLEGLMNGIVGISYEPGHPQSVYDEVWVVYAELEDCLEAYTQTYDTKTNLLAALWTDVQTSIDAHTSLYELAGFTSAQLTDISATYSFLQS